jgi:hypothetical protein
MRGIALWASAKEATRTGFPASSLDQALVPMRITGGGIDVILKTATRLQLASFF